MIYSKYQLDIQLAKPGMFDENIGYHPNFQCGKIYAQGR